MVIPVKRAKPTISSNLASSQRVDTARTIKTLEEQKAARKEYQAAQQIAKDVVLGGRKGQGMGKKEWEQVVKQAPVANLPYDERVAALESWIEDNKDVLFSPANVQRTQQYLKAEQSRMGKQYDQERAAYDSEQPNIYSAQKLNVESLLSDPNYKKEYNAAGQLVRIYKEGTYKSTKTDRPGSQWGELPYTPYEVLFQNGKPVREIQRDVRPVYVASGKKRVPYTKAKRTWGSTGYLTSAIVTKDVGPTKDPVIQSQKRYKEGQEVYSKKILYGGTKDKGRTETSIKTISEGIKRVMYPQVVEAKQRLAEVGLSEEVKRVKNITALSALAKYQVRKTYPMKKQPEQKLFTETRVKNVGKLSSLAFQNLRNIQAERIVKKREAMQKLPSSITAPVDNNRKLTVSQSGKVIVRDAKGKLVDSYRTTKEAALDFIYQAKTRIDQIKKYEKAKKQYFKDLAKNTYERFTAAWARKKEYYKLKEKKKEGQPTASFDKIKLLDHYYISPKQQLETTGGQGTSIKQEPSDYFKEMLQREFSEKLKKTTQQVNYVPYQKAPFGKTKKITEQEFVLAGQQRQDIFAKLREGKIEVKDIQELVRLPQIEMKYKQQQTEKRFGTAQQKRTQAYLDQLNLVFSEGTIKPSEYTKQLTQKQNIMSATNLDIIESIPKKTVGVGIAAAGGVYAGIASFSTPKELIKSFLRPDIIAVETGKTILRDPLSGGAEVVGTAYGFGKGLKVIEKAVPLRIGAVEISKKKPIQELSPMRDRIARAASDEGGYIGGSTAVEAQLPSGTFRKGVDVDVYFKGKQAPKKVVNFAEKALKIAQEEYVKQGKPPSRLKLEKAAKHIKVIDSKTSKDIVDVGTRVKGQDKIVDVGGIKVRDYKQILADKRAIVKFEKPTLDKYQKAVEDLEMAKKAEVELKKPPERKSVYGGLYLLRAERATPLIGISETGLVIRKPKPSQIPSVVESMVLPTISRKNIASYPQTALETAVLADKKVLETAGFTAGDIRKAEITRRIFKLLRDESSIYEFDYPKVTKVLDEKAVSSVTNFLQKNPKKYERVYGSFADIPQRPQWYQRVPGDIEIEFKSYEQAKTTGKDIVNLLKEKGYKSAELVDKQKSLSIKVKGEKAIELKHGQDPYSQIIGGKGARYGYSEVRGKIWYDKIKSQPMFEQLVRKAGAAATWWKDPTGNPIIDAALHRPKDIVDTYAITKSLAQSKYQKRSFADWFYDSSKRKGRESVLLAEEYKKLDWRNPEVAQKFKELDKNFLDYFKDIKVDYTAQLKPPTKTTPKVTTGKVMSALSRRSKSPSKPIISGYNLRSNVSSPLSSLLIKSSVSVGSATSALPSQYYSQISSASISSIPSMVSPKSSLSSLMRSSVSSVKSLVSGSGASQISSLYSVGSVGSVYSVLSKMSSVSSIKSIIKSPSPSPSGYSSGYYSQIPPSPLPKVPPPFFQDQERMKRKLMRRMMRFGYREKLYPTLALTKRTRMPRKASNGKGVMKYL